jgi:two-component system, chemotaxis family, chemotaxis protein CheY
MQSYTSAGEAMDNSKTVLIIDDASLVRLYYRSILEPAGFRVAEALNGVEALERLQSAPVDMLVVDINMPLMDGLTMLDTLRRKELPISATPALITSTESAEKDFAAARAAGANYYFVKPIDRDSLVHIAMMLCGVAP